MPSGTRALVGLSAAALVGSALAFGFYLMRSEREADARVAALTGGDPKRGPALMVRFGCAGCHQIPGVQGPGGRVGPPLRDVGARVYLAGRITNTPDNLVQWIANHRSADGDRRRATWPPIC
jgi:cytochrome c551/c552